MFAKLNAEKESADDFHTLKKRKAEQRKQSLKTAKFL
jgi:hypothetical protein